jgi:hypothetical protein
MSTASSLVVVILAEKSFISVEYTGISIRTIKRILRRMPMCYFILRRISSSGMRVLVFYIVLPVILQDHVDSHPLLLSAGKTKMVGLIAPIR